MTDAEPWEPIAREVLWQVLRRVVDDFEASVEQVGNTMYFGNELDPEQVERLRQVVVDLEYVTEEYLAAVCDGVEGWEGEELGPSWQLLDKDT